MSLNRLCPAVTAIALIGGTAHANVEVGGTAGVHVFSETNELGVNDVARAPSERNSALFGARVGVFFGPMLGVEAEFGIVPSEARQEVYDIWNITYRAHLVAQFLAKDDKNKVVPFVLLGGGGMSIVKTDEKGGVNAITKDTDAMLYIGIGAKYRVDNGWGLRADARLLFPPASNEDAKNVMAPASDGFTTDFELLLSIYKEFGRKKVAPPPPKDDDPDKDGIRGDADKCPTEPEDKDGFEDEDGCPDDDNDKDGVPDKDDKCPMQPEDKDGFQDEDGCPEADNDNDGIPDEKDGPDGSCKNEPEDKDGFQDEDGCPDLDNDSDGIPDAADKCPDKPETKNGYQDEDGCPDEVPEKVKKFTGTIQGINFAVGDDKLLPTSNAVLDKAVATMKEFPDMKLEIQGHTDDQPLKAKPGAKFQDNTQLSQGRADSVKNYFVAKGIDASRLTAKGYGETQPAVDPKGLTGAKLNEARAKNRRVEFKLNSVAPAAPAPAPAPAPNP